MTFHPHPRAGRVATRTLVTAAVAGAMLASPPVVRGQPPAAYAAPQPGTVYRYSGFTNTIVAADGWRVRYVDQLGRTGVRVGHFLVEDPSRPLTLDSGALERLWPLRRGSELVFRAREDALVWRWEFRVADTTTIQTPAGRFFVYVVQGIRTSEVAPRDRAASMLNTWWYAPAPGAVVRYRTTYLSGPGAGRRLSGELLAVERPRVGAAPAPPARSPR